MTRAVGPAPWRRLSGDAALPWVVALAGFAAMYVPLYWWAATSIWQKDEQAHGPIILAVVVWLFWQVRRGLLEMESKPAPLSGSLVFAFGIVMFALGRALSISVLEFSSQVPVVLGAVLLLKGWKAVRIAWFPVLYLVFMVPLPSVLVDAITGTLKQWVSVVAENLLYWAGYPIGRNGVTLTIGQYQMLVADACSGLHSMFSLAALGLLFMYIMARRSWLHNTIMLLAIAPIAFVANIVRVMVLVLVTYHLGDEAGQGFLHGAAGMVLMLVALVAFFALDGLLHLVLGSSRSSGEKASVVAFPPAGRPHA